VKFKAQLWQGQQPPVELTQNPAAAVGGLDSRLLFSDQAPRRAEHVAVMLFRRSEERQQVHLAIGDLHYRKCLDKVLSNRGSASDGTPMDRPSLLTGRLMQIVHKNGKL